MNRNIVYVDSTENSRQDFREVYKENNKDIDLVFVSELGKAKQLEMDKVDGIVLSNETEDEEISELIKYADDFESTFVILFSDTPFKEMKNNIIASSEGFVHRAKEDNEELLERLDEFMRDSEELDYPEPDYEEERLEAIEDYNVSQMMNSNDFKRLTKIGASAFDAEFCFLGLVDEDSEKFLSFTGSETTQLPRECTICTFAINRNEVMEVEDTREDPRFKDVEELQDIGIVWYAGMPIVTGEGYKIGSFCIADTERRQLSADEKELLVMLAEESMDKIELKYRKERL